MNPFTVCADRSPLAPCAGILRLLGVIFALDPDVLGGAFAGPGFAARHVLNTIEGLVGRSEPGLILFLREGGLCSLIEAESR